MALTRIKTDGITDGSILNADINSSAAVALSKLSTSGTAGSGNFLRGDGAWTAIDLTALNASNLTSGTVPDARFPSTLPAASGANLTALNGSNISSGTVAAARVATLNQNTTGSAATLTTARTIAGVSFDGSANISLNNNAITNGAGYLTSVATSNIADDAVTFAKMQEIPSARLIGRTTGGTGNPETLAAGDARTFLNVENGATADQTNAEIRAAVEAASDSNVFTDADHSKLNGIAASATNVTNNNQLTNGASYITASNAAITNKLLLAGGTLTGNLTIEDSVLRVGDYSGDNYTEIKQLTSDSYGFNFEHDNASAILNEQGSTNQALVLGDVNAGGSSVLLGVSVKEVGVASDAYVPKFTLTGAGALTLTSTCTATAFSGSGASLTSLNGSNISSGTVAAARLGSGTASSSSYLRGDGAWSTVNADGGNAATLDGIDSSSFCRLDGTSTQTISGGGNDRVVNLNSSSGNGSYIAFQKNGSSINYVGCSGGLGAGDSDDLALRATDRIIFLKGGTARAYFDSNGHFKPWGNNTYDLGDSGDRWRNVYTMDLQLSNEGSANDVDGTWGNYTIQEGEDELFLLNRRNGKKYKFNVTEVN